MNVLDRPRSAIILFPLILLLTTAVSVIAGEHPYELAPARLNVETPGMLPAGIGDRTPTRDPATPSVPSNTYYSGLTLQTLVDDNWEIVYLPQAAQNPPGRLTFNDYSDIWPRLDRGSNRIVFASDRDGDFELFVMSIDGTDLRQLTFNSSDDVAPTWSPDGQRIAFQAYRDGQAEIYVMNADGSGQRRLTVDGDYDGFPEWSPDGERIAFVSRRSGGYRITVVDADGHNLRQLSDQPYSLHPAWSPDGSRIAFDADADGDGWQELWVMNADGSDEQSLNCGHDANDCLSGSWSPSGSYLAITSIRWIEYQGEWYWYEARVHFLEVGTGYAIGPGNRSSNTDFYPHWETTDAMPPRSTVQRLPRYYPVDGFRLAWSGADVGPLDIISYDVQHRTVDGQWQNLVTGSEETSISYTPATVGEAISFRSRARDAHYNEETWPMTADATTIFYEWSFSGQVVDNRGTPLIDIGVATDASAVEPAASGADGHFVYYMTDNSSAMMAINQAEYGTLETWIEPGDRYRWPLYLPPSDNLLRNSALENPIGLGNWMPGGNLPITLDSNTFASGSSSGRLGSGCVDQPCLALRGTITDTTDDHSLLATAVDSDGRLHLIWTVYGHPTERLQHSLRTQDGIWSTPTTIAEVPVANHGLNAHLVVDSNDRLHLVWNDPIGIRYAQRLSDGIWTEPVTIGDLRYGYGSNRVVDLDTDLEDRLHVLYLDDSVSYYMERLPDGYWRVPQQLWSGRQRHTPLLAVGPDRRVHAVAALAPNPSDSEELLFHRWRSPDGIWTEDEVLSHDFRDDPRHLFVDHTGTLHLFAQRYDTLLHRQRRPGEVWTPWAEIPDTSGYNSIGADSRGRFHLVYSFDDGTGADTFYRRYLPDSGWQKPVILNQNFWSILPLQVDAYDQIHLVFEADLSAYNYWGRRPAKSSGTSAISQTVTIPATMSAPTLSFMARAEGDVPGDGTSLNVTIDDALNRTSVYSDAVDASWNLYWADLSPWTGETVTITFTLQQQAGDPDLLLWLDDVTLGSAYPDVTVDINGPVVAGRGAQPVYTLEYGNAGGVDAEGTTLRLTLSPELAFVASDLPPATISPLTWDLGTLSPKEAGNIGVTLTVSSAIVAMQDVALEAQVTAATDELQLANNDAAYAIFIGDRAYLPVARR